MDLRNLLKINQRVHIELLDYRGKTKSYSSRVENISENSVTLAGPLRNRIPVYIPKGNVITVSFSDSMCVYSFSSPVLDIVKDPIPLVVVEAPDSLEKIQKREFVRVPISLNVLLSYKVQEDEEEETREIWCKSRDLSGGGLMLLSMKPIPVKKGSKVDVTFQLESENIQGSCEIMRVYTELDTSGIERYILGVKFLNLSEKNRQFIIKFVYQRQIDLRRRGLL